MIRLGEEQLERAVSQLRDLGKLLAKAESDYQYYESMMKVTKARIFLEYQKSGMTIKDRHWLKHTKKLLLI